MAIPDLRQSPDLVLVVDPAGGILHASRAAEERLGYPPGGLDGAPLASLSDDGALVRFLEDPGFRATVRLRGRDGRPLDVEAVAFSTGEARIFVGLAPRDGAQNLHALKSAEEALRLSESRFRNAFEHMGIAAAIVGPDLRFAQVNRALCDMLGYTEEELLQKRFVEVTHPEDVETGGEAARRLLSGDATHLRLEKRYVRKDGSIAWGILTTSLLRDVEGRPIHFVSGVQDITEMKRAEEALRFSEARFRNAFDHMGVAACLISPDYRFLKVNRALCDMLGYREEELLGMGCADVTHPEDAADTAQAEGRLLSGESAHLRLEKRYLRKDRTLVHGVLEISLLRDVEGRPIQFVCGIQDITEMKRAEEALRFSEARFRNAFDHMGVAACLISPDYRFLKVNRALCDMLGYREEELLGMGCADVTHPEDAADTAQAEARLLSGEAAHLRLEKRYLRKDGSLVHGVLEISLLRDVEGRPIQFVCGIQDITEMKRAEEALRNAHDALERRVEERTTLLSEEIAQRRRAEENLKLYREFFRHAREAIVVVDREGRAVERNEAYRALFGGTDEEFRGRGPAFLPPERFARLTEAIRKDGFFEEETRGRDAAGRSVDALLSAFAVRNAAGEPLVYGALLRDITARKRREASLRAVLEGTAAVTSDLFFRALVRTLCAALGVRAAFVFRVLNPRRVRTMAAWVGNDFAPEKEYELAGTPCEGVIGGQVVVHPRGVRTLYPSSADLEMLEAESYVGVPILDPGGEVVGHLSVIDNAPLEDAEFKTSLLRLFAGRAGAELVRRRAEEALRESEERWKSLVVNIPSIIMTVNRDKRIMTINRTVPGVTVEEVIGTHVFEWIPPEGRATVGGALEQVFATGQPTDFEVQAMGPNRGLAWWDSRLSPIVIRGEVVGVTLMTTDISVRKETERRLEALADEQSLVLSQMRDFLYRHDTKGVFTFISPAVEQITGRSVEEWRTHYTEYLTENPINRAVIESTEATLRTGQQSAPYLVEVRHKDGRPVLLEVNERAYYEDGQIAGVVGVARDVTERRKADEALQFQKTLLESQSEAAIDGILVVSMEGKMISFNRRFLEMWDMPREIVESRDDAVALQSVLGALVDPEPFLSRVRALYEHPEEESRDELFLKDGRVFDRYSAPIRSRGGVLYGRVWYFRDVTGRKRTEQELRRAAEETRKAYEDLKQAQAQLIRTEKLASIGVLVSGVAHEINNPLNVMYGNLQLLQETAGSLPLRFRNMIRDALKAGQHARRIMDDFRGYARDVRMAEPVDLNQCLEEAVTLMKPGFRRRIKLVKRLGRIPPVRCFRGQMSQVFLNLLKNAVEAVDKRGTVTVRTRHRAGRVIVEVADTGRGMSEEIRARLFEPFFTTKPVGKGLGLGLSISAVILQNHGGQISVKSRLGKGSVFLVEIPVGS